MRHFFDLLDWLLLYFHIFGRNLLRVRRLIFVRKMLLFYDVFVKTLPQNIVKAHTLIHVAFSVSIDRAQLLKVLLSQGRLFLNRVFAHRLQRLELVLAYLVPLFEIQIILKSWGRLEIMLNRFILPMRNILIDQMVFLRHAINVIGFHKASRLVLLHEIATGRVRLEKGDMWVKLGGFLPRSAHQRGR